MSDVATQTPATEILGAFIANLRFEDIPADLVEHAKLCLLDTIGCGLFGSTLPWTHILRDSIEAVEGAGQVPVWGTSRALSPSHAALVNGAAVHGFELDDLHKESILHAGSAVAPAVFAAAHIRRGVSGKDALRALILGYEVGARIGAALGTPHLLQGWHPTGTHGTLASAAASAAVLGLDGAQAQHALGVAVSQAAGLMAAQYSSMVKRFHAGRAFQSGLYSAVLAKNGYTGIIDALENEYGGYANTFSPEFDLGPVAAELGERWEAKRFGFKPYSSNGSCHPTIELISDLRNEYGLRPEMIAKIHLRTSTATFAHVGWTLSARQCDNRANEHQLHRLGNSD